MQRTRPRLVLILLITKEYWSNRTERYEERIDRELRLVARCGRSIRDFQYQSVDLSSLRTLTDDSHGKQ